MTAIHTANLHETLRETTARDDRPFHEDLDVHLVETLLSKGLMHNGVVPTLTIPEVARAADLIGYVIARMRIGQLSFEQQELLEYVFDQGANAYEQANFHPVRHLERVVRASLGLDPRLAFLPNFPDELT